MPQSNPTLPKLIFAIDLDETIFVAEDRLDQVHDLHSLSPLRPKDYPCLSGFSETKSKGVPAFIINLPELSEIFETACDKCDELVILTSGTYNKESILNLLQNNLLVPLKTLEKIARAHFHTPITDCKYFNPHPTPQSLTQIIQMTKGDRISAIKNQLPELNGKWILFDDHPIHISSCLSKGIMAVRATTNNPDKNCYSEVLARIEEAHEELSLHKTAKLLISLKSAFPDKENVNPAKKSKPDHSLVINQPFCISANKLV